MKTISFLITTYLVCLLVPLVHSEISVYSPDWLSDYYSKQPRFVTSVATFGRVPYGHNLMGVLKLADPENACGLKVHYLNGAPGMTLKSSPIMIAYRGKCTFAEKAMNAQKSGAIALLVVDNKQEYPKRIIPYAPEQATMNIKIPMVLVDKTQSEELMRAIKMQADEPGFQDEGVIISLKFPIYKEETANVMYKLDVSDQKSLISFVKVAGFLKQMKEKVKVSLVHDIIFYKDEKVNRCLGFLEGSVCYTPAKSPEDSSKPGNTESHDQSLLYEVLRQIALYGKSTFEEFAEYISKFTENCFSEKEKVIIRDVDKCSIEAVNQTSNPEFYKTIFQKVNNQLQDQQVIESETLLFNAISQNQQRLERFLPVTPSIKINRKVFLGVVDPIHVLGEVCQSLIVPPSVCRTTDKEFIEEIEKAKGALFYLKVLLFSVLTGIICLTVFYCVFKLKLRSDLKLLAEEEIEKTLSKYYKDKRGYTDVQKNEENDEEDNETEDKELSAM